MCQGAVCPERLVAGGTCRLQSALHLTQGHRCQEHGTADGAAVGSRVAAWH